MNIIGLRDPIFNSVFYVKSDIKVLPCDYVVYKDHDGYRYLAEVVIDKHKEDLINTSIKGYKIVAKATSYDIECNLNNINLYNDVRDIFDKSVSEANLDIPFYNFEYSLDKKKLKLYFYKNEPVDFRDLIKAILKNHSGKIKLQLIQVQGREYAKIHGGVGICGLEVCCHNFNYQRPIYPKDYFDFKGYNVDLKLGSRGHCGAAKCCVIFEVEDYLNFINKLPDYGTKLSYEDNLYTCHDIDFFKQTIVLKPVKKDDEIIILSLEEVLDIYGS